jgi:hypothetical protein
VTSELHALAGGWFGFWAMLLTGRAAIWLVWSGAHWYPSHLVLWVQGRGYTDSTYQGWRRHFGQKADFGEDGSDMFPILRRTNQTRCSPLTLGPVPVLLAGGLWWYGEPWLAGIAALWAIWVPLRVLMGLRRG